MPVVAARAPLLERGVVAGEQRPEAEYRAVRSDAAAGLGSLHFSCARGATASGGVALEHAWRAVAAMRGAVALSPDSPALGINLCLMVWEYYRRAHAATAERGIPAEQQHAQAPVPWRTLLAEALQAYARAVRARPELTNSPLRNAMHAAAAELSGNK